jgi:1-acyl-sn-glycerol-3-phosphate acyltransferase
MFFRFFSKTILKLLGWKIRGRVPYLNKYIAVSAPHSSNMDFLLGALYFMTINTKAHFLIKKELFFFPLNFLLKAAGGIPVDRSNPVGVVDTMVKYFKTRKKFILIITPEGTRKRVTHWKKGFFYIANQTNVPVVLSYFDYKEKIIHIDKPYMLSNDGDSEMKKIKLYFKDVHPRHPELFSIGNIDE